MSLPAGPASCMRGTLLPGWQPACLSVRSKVSQLFIDQLHQATGAAGPRTVDAAHESTTLPGSKLTAGSTNSWIRLCWPQQRRPPPAVTSSSQPARAPSFTPLVRAMQWGWGRCACRFVRWPHPVTQHPAQAASKTVAGPLPDADDLGPLGGDSHLASRTPQPVTTLPPCFPQPPHPRPLPTPLHCPSPDHPLPSAAGFAQSAAANRAIVAEFNLEATPHASFCKFAFQGRAGDLLPAAFGVEAEVEAAMRAQQAAYQQGAVGNGSSVLQDLIHNHKLL